MNHAFTDLACYIRSNVFLTGFGEPQRLQSLAVSGNLLDVLGVHPMLGRTFQEEETYDGKGRVVILSYGLRKTQFGGDTGIIGRTISLTEKNYEVIGVMPPGFFFPSREIQLWRNLGLSPKRFIEDRRPHYVGVLGRLRPEVSLSRASAEMTAIASRLEQAYSLTNTKMGVRLDRFHDALFLEEKQPLLILMAAVLLLFLIVCSNIANLQLGRASTRSREFGIRQALGAGRSRLTGQLLTESLLLSLLGGGLGLAVAAMLRYLLTTLAPERIPGFAEVRMDSWVIVFAATVTLFAPLLFGLTPALVSSRTGSLQDRAGIALRGSRSLRSALVACEVALSVILVAGSALLIESFVRLQSVEPGFNPGQALSFSLALPDTRYAKDESMVQAVSRIEQNLRSQPGVEAAGTSLVLPLRGFAWTSDATPEGRAAGDYERELRFNCITPEYFHATGIKLLRGRGFNQFDQANSQPVTIVNEALERSYFRGQSALGKRIRFGRPYDKDPWVTIVGVAADTKQEAMGAQVQPLAYKPFAQHANDDVVFVVRGTGLTESLVRRAVSDFDGGLAINDLAPLQEVITMSVGNQRFRASLVGSFAGIALFLAALGIYGVLAYSVAQRAKEIGVRLALGAPPARLFRMVVSEGMLPVAWGAAVGLAGAFGAARLIQTLLFGIAPTNAASYLATCAIIVTVALAACTLPALRAIRIDPLISLREQ
jgi:putative ABC transport system permease protein